MVCTCEAYNCGKKREKGQTGISFHRFPKDQDLYKQWLRAIKKDDNWKPGSESKVCSRHFTPDSFEQGKGRKKLKDDAVPTIFTASEDSDKKTASEDPDKKTKAKRPAQEKNAPNEENGASEEADDAGDAEVPEAPAKEEEEPEAPPKKKGRPAKAKNGDVATKEPAKKKKKAK